MFETGDWINPWENPHHKTPGPYWLIACFYQLLGVNEIAVRLPSVLLSLGCLLLIYQIAVNLFDKQIGLLSAFILSLEFLWLRYSYLGNPDYITIFIFLTAILCLIKYSGRVVFPNSHGNLEYGILSKDLYLLLFGCCLSLMILCRGFLAGMLILSLLPYLSVSIRKFKYFQKNYFYLGIFIGLIPLGLWLYLSFQRYEVESFRALFSLFVSLSQEQRRNNGYFYYVINTLGLCFPWIFFSIIGAITYWKKKKKEHFLILGIPLSIFLMITFYETRLSHYALPLYPFLAIFAALGIHELIESWEKERSPQLLIKVISCMLGFLGSLFILLNILAQVPESWLFFEFDGLEFAYIVLPLGCAWVYLAWLIFQKKTSQEWIASLLLGQWLSFILLVASGLLTDVNPELKMMISEPEIQTVLQNHQIALFGGGKTQVLLKFYSPKVNYMAKELSDVNIDGFAWVKSEFLAKNWIQHEVVGEYKSWQLIQRK
ncbi:glycosyltransferase family 39 protein [[Leptolyngbya] sp. PCC 7376]|uniref:ArnT family glycosyltransferase n=1 Tax=[Leptolyngbya] sp. PCC 7376 TaxID=111781 RepID=UPI001359EF37|nr:glycosyltransferase family 39 protein [[Leptolyngbya] sp. PCC 7376]